MKSATTSATTSASTMNDEQLEEEEMSKLISPSSTATESGDDYVDDDDIESDDFDFSSDEKYSKKNRSKKNRMSCSWFNVLVSTCTGTGTGTGTCNCNCNCTTLASCEKQRREQRREQQLRNQKYCHNKCSAPRVVFHILCLIIIFPIVIYLIMSWIHYHDRHHYNYSVSTSDLTISNIFPTALYSKKKKKLTDNQHKHIINNSYTDTGKIYSLLDFQNEFSIAPYWEDVLSHYNVPIKALSSLYYNEDKKENPSTVFNDEKYGLSRSSSSSPKQVNEDDSDETDFDHFIIPHLGPCYLPLKQKDMDSIQWDKLIEKNYKKPHSKRNITYPLPYNKKADKFDIIDSFTKTKLSSSSSKYNQTNQESSNNLQQEEQLLNLENYCRPGFLIIGAGKCGTSSLYHYLTGHDRVVPSKQKQIHYFKYYYHRPMNWYLSHFYSTTDFLSSGALMTGEASPGYLVSYS